MNYTHHHTSDPEAPLIIDLFAGGGGASSHLAAALVRANVDHLVPLHVAV